MEPRSSLPVRNSVILECWGGRVAKGVTVCDGTHCWVRGEDTGLAPTEEEGQEGQSSGIRTQVLVPGRHISGNEVRFQPIFTKLSAVLGTFTESQETGLWAQDYRWGN